MSAIQRSSRSSGAKFRIGTGTVSEINTTLGADVFRVQIPPGTAPITIRELEDAGPLRGRDGERAKAPSR